MTFRQKLATKVIGQSYQLCVKFCRLCRYLGISVVRLLPITLLNSDFQHLASVTIQLIYSWWLGLSMMHSDVIFLIKEGNTILRDIQRIYLGIRQQIVYYLAQDRQVVGNTQLTRQQNQVPGDADQDVSSRQFSRYLLGTSNDPLNFKWNFMLTLKMKTELNVGKLPITVLTYRQGEFLNIINDDILMCYCLWCNIDCNCRPHSSKEE